PDNDPATPLTVCPGEHDLHPPDGANPDGPYSIVWWDPHALALGVESPLGIRRETLIVKDVPEAVVAEGLREYSSWRDGRETAIERGSTPSIVVRTATEWAADISDFRFQISDSRTVTQAGLFDEPVEETHRPPPELDVAVVDLRGPAHPDAAGGTRFGALGHAVLAV